MSETNVLLAVGDPQNRTDLTSCLNNTPGIRLRTVKNADEAMLAFQDSIDRFDLMILDSPDHCPASKNLMERIKGDRRLATIPIVLLTPAKPTADQLRDGAATGAFHFLVMPANHDAILAVIHAALANSSFRNFLRQQMGAQAELSAPLSNGEFSIRTLEEAGELAGLVAQACPNAEAALFGISELLVNGIEHGNLGLTYEQKSQLVLNDQWKKEVDRRCALPENLAKRVRLSFQRIENRITVRISDDGQGFAWQKYLDLEPKRASDPNGRGIALARLLSFSSIHYEGSGNVAVATIGPDSKQPSQE